MSSTAISKKIVIGTGVMISGLVIARQFNWWPFGSKAFNAPNLWPPQSDKNRIFLPVRYKEELHPILIQKKPLLLNFTVRGHDACNKLTGALQRIVSLETEKSINLVDIEADEPDNQELLTEYRVNAIPTVVALRKQLIVDRYEDPELLTDKNREVDWIKLKEWIEKNADEPEN